MKTVKIGDHTFFLPFADLIPMKPEQRENLRAGIQEIGAVQIPVVIWKEKNTAFEHTVVDGANRVIEAAALKLSKENVPTMLRSFASEKEAKAFCEEVNANRRHDEALARSHRESRIARVQEARAEGKSIRAIAATEGVDPATIHRDLHANESAQVLHDATPETENHPENTNGTTGSGNVQPPSDGGEAPAPPATVTGRDGKTYTAKKTPLLCDRCKMVAPGVGCPDCPMCKAARDADAKKKKAAAARKKKEAAKRQDVKDQTGAVVPDQLRDVFADQTLPDLIAELESVEVMLRPEPWTTRAGKLTAHYPFILIEKVKEHAWEALHQLQCALSAMKAGVPYAVCPKCNGVDSTNNGKTCRTCRGGGHIPEHRFQELQADKTKA